MNLSESEFSSILNKICTRDTRIAKLDAPDSPFSCILLATAGLMRLNLGHRITQRLDSKIFPYAVGQGALGIEVRMDRPNMRQLVLGADHKPSRWRGMAERAMLRTLQGGCSSPIGVYSAFEVEDDLAEVNAGGQLVLQATVLDIEGKNELYAEQSGLLRSDDDANGLGVSVAQMLLGKGAHDLLVR